MAQLPEVHRKAIVVAGHTDIVASDVDYWRLQGERGVLERRHVPTLRAGGVTAICEHIGGDSRYGYLPATHLSTTPLQRVMRNLDHIYMEVEENESLLVARSVADIRRAKQEDRIAIVICLEGAAPLEDEVAYLRNLYRLGLRCLGLTHNCRNSVADGVLERTGGGLTYFGMDVVRECNRLGIVVDAAHLSPRGIEDLLGISSQPIVISHGMANAVYPSVFNFTDDQIRAVAAGGGVIGIHALNLVVTDSPQSTLDHLLRHVIHLAEVGGVDCVGIGPDLMEHWQEGQFKMVTQGAAKFASIPVKPFDFTYPVGFQSMAELGNVTEGLASLGFDDEDLVKILGGNFLRVFGRVWGN